MSEQPSLDDEIMATLEFIDSRVLSEQETLAVLNVTLALKVKAFCRDETEVRKTLADMHERALRGAGVDDKPYRLQ